MNHNNIFNEESFSNIEVYYYKRLRGSMVAIIMNQFLKHNIERNKTALFS